MLQEPSTANVKPTAISLLTKLIEASFTCVAACNTPTTRPAINAANSAGPAMRQQTKKAFRKSSTAPSVVIGRLQTGREFTGSWGDGELREIFLGAKLLESLRHVLRTRNIFLKGDANSVPIRRPIQASRISPPPDLPVRSRVAHFRAVHV